MGFTEACDSNCLLEKSLKQTMDNAQSSLTNAPDILTESERQYYTFKGGEEEYQRFLFQKYTAEINKITETQLTNHNNYINDILKLIEQNITEYKYALPMNSLINYNKYFNKHMTTNLDKEKGETLTNERKISYEYIELDKLKNIKLFLIILFYFLLINYIFFGIILGNKYKSFKHWFIVLNYALLPLYTSNIAALLIYIYNKIYNFFS